MSGNSRLSDEEIAAVVERAHEISELETRLKPGESEMEQYVRVAEEMGVPREAMEQALKERFAFLEEKLDTGQIVFAKSGDGHFYLAKVKSAAEGRAQIKFMNGSDAVVGVHELQRATFTPGTQMDFYTKQYGMYIRGTCEAFNETAQTISLRAWGEMHSVPLDKVRLRKEQPGLNVSIKTWMIAGVSLLAGGVALRWSRGW